MAARVLAVLIASFWFAVFVEKSWIFCGESHWYSYEDGLNPARASQPACCRGIPPSGFIHTWRARGSEPLRP